MTEELHEPNKKSIVPMLMAVGMGVTFEASPRPIRRLAQPEYSFNEKEAQAAYDNWGCNCGPSALATMLGLTPDDVRHHIPDFDAKRYTSPTMMKQALASLGVGYGVDRRGENNKDFAHYGLVRIQWTGPWTKPGVPARAAYRETHWVGSMTHGAIMYVFDINGGWLHSAHWKERVVPLLTAMNKRADGGWYSTHRWELSI